MPRPRARGARLLRWEQSGALAFRERHAGPPRDVVRLSRAWLGVPGYLFGGAALALGALLLVGVAASMVGGILTAVGLVLVGARLFVAVDGRTRTVTRAIGVFVPMMTTSARTLAGANEVRIEAERAMTGRGMGVIGFDVTVGGGARDERVWFEARHEEAWHVGAEVARVLSVPAYSVPA